MVSLLHSAGDRGNMLHHSGTLGGLGCNVGSRSARKVRWPLAARRRFRARCGGSPVRTLAQERAQAGEDFSRSRARPGARYILRSSQMESETRQRPTEPTTCPEPFTSSSNAPPPAKWLAWMSWRSASVPLGSGLRPCSARAVKTRRSIDPIVQRVQKDWLRGRIDSTVPHPFGADLRSVCLPPLGSNLRSGSRRIMRLVR
jgi:hypothetical protein